MATTGEREQKSSGARPHAIAGVMRVSIKAMGMMSGPERRRPASARMSSRSSPAMVAVPLMRSRRSPLLDDEWDERVVAARAVRIDRRSVASHFLDVLVGGAVERDMSGAYGRGVCRWAHSAPSARIAAALDGESQNRRGYRPSRMGPGRDATAPCGDTTEGTNEASGWWPGGSMRPRGEG
jgi:hypothetical protein